MMTKTEISRDEVFSAYIVSFNEKKGAYVILKSGATSIIRDIQNMQPEDHLHIEAIEITWGEFCDMEEYNEIEDGEIRKFKPNLITPEMVQDILDIFHHKPDAEGSGDE